MVSVYDCVLQAAKAVSRSLAECVSHLPGQKEVEEALRRVADSSKRLLSEQVPTSTACSHRIGPHLRVPHRIEPQAHIPH